MAMFSLPEGILNYPKMGEMGWNWNSNSQQLNMSHMSFSSQAQQRCAETAATQRSQGRIAVKIPELKGTSTGKPNKFGGSKTWFPVKMFP